MADNQAEKLMEKMQMCLKILHEYAWLIDSYILDFFVQNHYQNLPSSWRNYFHKISIEELGGFLDFQNRELSGIWPLSLITLRFLCKYLCLPRTPSERDISHDVTLNKKCSSSNRLHIDDKKLFPKCDSQVSQTISYIKNTKLKNSFVKHVKPKKRYEILTMARITAEVASTLNTYHLVDIGSGLGHLSRISGFGYGFNVLSIESQTVFSKEAEKLDWELQTTASKHLNPDDLELLNERKPIHVQKTITYEMSPKDFSQFVRDNFNNVEDDFKCGIVGLHPCGNLALMLLKLFIHCEEIKFINIVGCCYHKLTVSSENVEENGFPASRFGMSMCANISQEARALACHALEIYCKRLQANDYGHLQIHCFRATLEYLIKKNWPQLCKTALNNVKYEPQLTFELYCQKALKNHQVRIPEEDLKSETTLKYLSQWKNVVIYYSLRLMLAPLIETVMLVDRMLYLLENGYQCNVAAVFDPEISPRNYVLSATKS